MNIDYSDYNYTHEYSNFPTELYSVNNFRDVDNAVVPGTSIYIYSLIEELSACQLNGNFERSTEIMDEYGDILRPYLFASSDVNKIEEETRNLEIFSVGKKQGIFYSEIEPTSDVLSDHNDVWISGVI